MRTELWGGVISVGLVLGGCGDAGPRTLDTDGIVATGGDVDDGASSSSSTSKSDSGTTTSGSTGDEPDDEGTSSTGEVEEPVEEPCGTSEWTCVVVEPSGPYGERTFDVPAAQNWVNTGLFLRAGETATITASGDWFVNAGEGNPIDHGPCVIGDVVARIGLHYKDPALTCVDGPTTFTADKDGILYVGGLPENDLGETYEARVDASGSKTVTVESAGDTVPTVEAARAGDFDYAAVASGWVEVRGDHVIVTLPAATAGQDAGSIRDAMATLDEIYELERELRGAVPQHGQRIRFFPDPDVVPIGYMLAGNPVRMDPVLVESTFANRITLAGESGVDIWGFAHELGHDFTFVGRLWWYQENSLESWPNLFSIYAFEGLGVPLHDQAATCTSGSSAVAYNAWDPWSGLCFLLQFQFAYGWDFYATFFAELNAIDPATVPSGAAAWTFNHDRFEAIAGEDVTARFNAWSVPNPG